MSKWLPRTSHSDQTAERAVHVQHVKCLSATSHLYTEEDKISTFRELQATFCTLFAELDDNASAVKGVPRPALRTIVEAESGRSFTELCVVSGALGASTQTLAAIELSTQLQEDSAEVSKSAAKIVHFQAAEGSHNVEYKQPNSSPCTQPRCTRTSEDGCRRISTGSGWNECGALDEQLPDEDAVLSLRQRQATSSYWADDPIWRYKPPRISISRDSPPNPPTTNRHTAFLKAVQRSIHAAVSAMHTRTHTARTNAQAPSSCASHRKRTTETTLPGDVLTHRSTDLARVDSDSSAASARIPSTGGELLPPEDTLHPDGLINREQLNELRELARRRRARSQSITTAGQIGAEVKALGQVSPRPYAPRAHFPPACGLPVRSSAHVRLPQARAAVKRCPARMQMRSQPPWCACMQMCSPPRCACMQTGTLAHR